MSDKDIPQNDRGGGQEPVHDGTANDGAVNDGAVNDGAVNDGAVNDAAEPRAHSGSRWEPGPGAPAGAQGGPAAPPAETAGAAQTADTADTAGAADSGRDSDVTAEHPSPAAPWTPGPTVRSTGPTLTAGRRGRLALAAVAAGLVLVGGAGGFTLGHAAAGDGNGPARIQPAGDHGFPGGGARGDGGHEDERFEGGRPGFGGDDDGDDTGSRP